MNTYELRSQLRDTDAEELLLLAGTKDGASICPTEVEERLGEAFPFAQAAAVLRSSALARPPKYAGCVTLTALGQSVASDVAESRHSGEDRELRVQLSILQWLVAQPSPPSSAARFLDDDLARVDDLVVNADELAEQVDQLVDLELIAVTPSAQSRLLRPRLTRAGRTAARMGSVHRYLSTRQAPTTQVTNDYSVRVDGPRVGGDLRIVTGESNTVGW